MDLSKYLDIRKQQQQDTESSIRHQEQVGVTEIVGQKVLYATESLIKYLEGHVTKTEVINQLDSIHTPDIDGVVKAVEVLDTTIRQRPTTDLSGVIEIMSQVLEQAKAIPKELPQTPDSFKPIDYSSEFKSLTTAIQAVEKVVKEQELEVKTPDVNVAAPNVQVDAPDLTPLQKGLSDVQKAVKAIVIPKPEKLDTSELEKLITAQNKTLDKILRKPVSGGGGGGSSWVATGTNGYPQPLKLNSSGNLVTSAQTTSARYDLSAPIYYVGEAPVGTLDGDSLWTITKYDLTTNPYSGKVATASTWTGRAGATYN